jgi:hypothetical protein
MRADGPTDADMAGKPAFPLHLLRIRGRTFLRSMGILPTLPATDETSNEQGANQSRRVCVRVRLVC